MYWHKGIKIVVEEPSRDQLESENSLPLLRNFVVVTPNFNMGEYLAETIESVLANLGDGDRYYVVDGGSTDCSLEVLRNYEHKLAGWISERDRGYADALAKGFAVGGEAEYQCWINCGDLQLPGALQRARKSLIETGADMIFGDDFYADEAANILQVSDGYVDDLRSMMLYGGWSPLQDACFWRSSLYQRSGGINPDVRFAADYDLFLRMSQEGICTHVPIVFSVFRRHDKQTSKAHANAYRLERESVRRKVLGGIDSIRPRRSLYKAPYYWCAARLKARLFAKHAESDRLIGRSIREFRCADTKDILSS